MKYLTLTCAATLALASQLAFSLQVAFHNRIAADSAHSAAAVAGKPPAPATVQPLVGRWLDLNSLSYATRYRNTVNLHGRRLFRFGQETYVADGRVKLDPNGNYAIGFHATTGRYFNWSYADLIGGQYKDSVVAARGYKTPAETALLNYAVAKDPNGLTYKAGIPSRGGYFYPRQLFFSATPIPQLTFEVGSLFIEHGQNTEITSFDDDGYISGERLRLHDPKHFFFDEMTATSAELNSPLTPNFFERGGDLKRANYSQYLAEKRFSRNLIASVDYTLVNHTHTMREAVSFKIPSGRFIDGARVEVYQRPNTVTLAGLSFADGYGFAVSAHQTFFKRYGFEAGYADVDERYAIYSGSIYLAAVGFAWNGDRYETGKRGFTKAEVKLPDGLSLFGFYTHAIVPITIGHNEQGLNAGLQVDMKTLVNKTKKIF